MNFLSFPRNSPQEQEVSSPLSQKKLCLQTKEQINLRPFICSNQLWNCLPFSPFLNCKLIRYIFSIYSGVRPVAWAIVSTGSPICFMFRAISSCFSLSPSTRPFSIPFSIPSSILSCKPFSKPSAYPLSSALLRMVRSTRTASQKSS